ncbi:MAG: cytochrome c biogenesis protein CcsA [Fimbriimonadales bacterium]
MEPIPSLPSPPEWSLDVGYFGRFCVFLAIALFAVAAVGWLLTPRNESLTKIAARSFTAGCVSLFGAFASLATLFIETRLEYTYVYDHGDASNAIPYRIAGIWAGQQGSFLLWACCSAFFGLLAVRGTGILRRWFTIAYSGFLLALASILAYESPFGLNRVGGQPVVPASGEGLTPALQNYWVTIHPPTIFLGFGALTVLAAYAFSALATNKPKEWAPMVRPWAIISLTVTGLGLCMGGFWAYETLGWGGFWGWDPVENVSFVPWIFSAAFVHGLMVQITKKTWVIPNLLLGGLPFILFVYGTFLTRSGVLNETSVHSFANMDHMALWLLAGFGVVSIATFLWLWVWRALQYRKESAPSEAPPKGLHREGLFRLGAWLMAGLGLGAAIGMSWPWFTALAGQKPKVVEAGLYHHTLVWLYIPLMIAMSLGPLVAWRGMGAREFTNRIWGVFCVTIAVVGVMMMIVGRSPHIHSITADNYIDILRFPSIKILHLPATNIRVGLMAWILILTSLSAFVAVANIWRISELIKRSKMSAAAFLAHVGVAVLMAGLIISQGFEQKETINVAEGSHAIGLGYFVSYKGMTSDTFDRNNKVLFDVQRGDEKWTASPGYYLTDGGDEGDRPMVWPHIQSHPFYDIYFSLNPPSNEIGVETTLKPGETKNINGYQVTYEKLTREGEPGKDGTKFGALLKVDGGAGPTEVNPKMVVGQGGFGMIPAPIDDKMMIEMRHMEAGPNTATLQLLSQKMVYPVTMFFKPMTILVWLGTGLLAIAGLLSAWYRRFRAVATPAAVTAAAQVAMSPSRPRKKAIALKA